MPKTSTQIWSVPDVSMYHDKKDENLITEIELPGVRKEDIKLETGQESFCVKAKRDRISYDSCFYFSHRVRPEKSNASFINGLLRISVPILKEEMRARKIAIQ